MPFAVLFVLALLGPFRQSTAPPAVEGGAEPDLSSPALVAAAPGLAAVPDLVLIGYPVHGRSARSLRQSMNAGRPAELEGDRFDSVTRWRYGVRWRSRSTGECDPASAEVKVSFVVTLPELADRAQLNRADLAAWDRYFTALIAHEYNHVRIGLAGAGRMRAHIQGAPDCAAMQAARQEIAEQIREASRLYDESTHHGRTEGATYP